MKLPRKMGYSFNKTRKGETMDLFEIVSSFIPDEQKADIKAKIDGELGGLIKNKETEVRKTLSKKYGVNLFEDDTEKAFSESLFVKKETLETIRQENTATKTQLETLNKELTNYKEEKSFNELSIKLIKQGFNADRLEAVKPLLKDSKESETADDKVKRIKSLVPELFLDPKITKQMYNDENDKDRTKTDAEKYFEMKTKTTNR